MINKRIGKRIHKDGRHIDRSKEKGAFLESLNDEMVQSHNKINKHILNAKRRDSAAIKNFGYCKICKTICRPISRQQAKVMAVAKKKGKPVYCIDCFIKRQKVLGKYRGKQ